MITRRYFARPCGLYREHFYSRFFSTPSRISAEPIDLAGRVLLVIETGAFVALAMFASSRFIAWRHIVMPVEIWFAAYGYVLILIVMLIASFGRNKNPGIIDNSLSPRTSLCQEAIKNLNLIRRAK